MLRILIVDDDLVDCEMVFRALSKSDLETEITHASCVDDGIDYFQKAEFDIVLLDCKMPRRDGIEMIVELRGLPKNESSAIIMMSSSEDEALALACIKAGAQDFLPKSEITEKRLRRSLQQAKAKFDLELELHKSHQKIQMLAESDPLTGLGNRYLFDENIRRAVAINQRNNGFLALILFDLDNFKAVNDTHGHYIGDILLQEIAARIKTTLRGNECFSRFGGDEFAIIAGGLKEVSFANKIGQRIIDVMQTPFEINGQTITSSLSIGIAIHPVNCQTSTELFKFSDIAMYRAKKIANNHICFFEEEMQNEVFRRYLLEKELRNAVATGG
jgi:diguanylate cyclase (GGDEF)-like protein